MVVLDHIAARVLPHTVIVDVGGGASVAMPRKSLEWELRYGDPGDVNFSSASVAATLRYLVLECSRDEAWRRIKLMRAAIEGVDNGDE